MSAYLEMIKPAEDIKLRSFVDNGHMFVHPHWHKEVEIIFVKKGTVNIGVNDKPITLHEGDIYIINGGDVHYFFASPNSERIILIFDPSLFQELAEAKEKSLKSQIAKMYPSSHDWNADLVSKVHALLFAILTEIESKEVGYQYAIKARMFELVTLFFREIPLKATKDVSESKIKYSEQKEILEKLDLIFNYIEEHYKEGITLEEVADYIGFSHFYFTKFFKRNTGMTFITFLNYYRINKARWLLMNENLPVSEIAFEAGFQSTKTFYRLFKQETQMSPLQYQKQYYEMLQ